MGSAGASDTRPLGAAPKALRSHPREPGDEYAGRVVSDEGPARKY
jgi:hypothetical protein